MIFRENVYYGVFKEVAEPDGVHLDGGLHLSIGMVIHFNNANLRDLLTGFGPSQIENKAWAKSAPPTTP